MIVEELARLRKLKFVEHCVPESPGEVRSCWVKSRVHQVNQ